MIALGKSLLGQRRVPLALLAMITASGGYARSALSPLQEAVATTLALSDYQMAVIQGPAAGVPLAIATVPLGTLIDRYSRARLLLALILIELAGTLITAYAGSFSVLLLGRSLAGFGGLTTFPVSLALLCDGSSPELRGRATMVISLGQVAGNAAAFALGGAVLGVAVAGSDEWRIALLWMSVPLVLIALLTSLLREPRRTTSGPAPRIAGCCREIWALRRTMAPVMVGLAMMEINIGAILIWAGPALMRSFHAGPQQVGPVLAGGVLLSGTIGPLAGGVLADRCQSSCGPRRTSVALSALSLLRVPFSIFNWIADLSFASILLFVSMTVMMGIAVMGTSLFTLIVPERSRGFFLSVLVAANVLFALGVSPLVVSALSAALGGPAHLASALAGVLMSASLIACGAFAAGPPCQRASVGSAHS